MTVCLLSATFATEPRWLTEAADVFRRKLPDRVIIANPLPTVRSIDLHQKWRDTYMRCASECGIIMSWLCFSSNPRANKAAYPLIENALGNEERFVVGVQPEFPEVSTGIRQFLKEKQHPWHESFIATCDKVIELAQAQLTQRPRIHA